MRVAVVAEQLRADVPGGTGRYVAELIPALRAAAADGDRVRSWTVPGAGSPYGRRALAELWRRGLGPRPRRADVTHAPTLLAPPGNAAHVVTIHDAVPWTHPETLTEHGARWHRAMAQRVARRAAAVIVPSRAVADELAGLLPELDADRVHVIGMGATAALTMPAPDDAERATELKLPRRYLLSLATLEPRKGLDTLLAALDTPGAPGLPLLVAGQPGWGGVDAAAEVARRGLANVRILGRLGDADLGVVLRRATVLVLPSRAEGFGLPVLEAMAAGVPVVCSDVPALRELGAGAVRLVPVDARAELARALAEVEADDALRARMADAGLVRAAEYTWARTAEATWAVYRAIGRSAARFRRDRAGSA